MTRPTGAQPSDSWTTLKRYRINQLPVVAHGKLLGIVTDLIFA
jgi:CBS domain-containing protein